MISAHAFYNEIDPLKAEILRETIKAGAIAPGDVDERSIADVQPGDLAGYTQAHWFAGGGFWSLALRQAGWPDEREVWTGSCPCPSFSAAGKRAGFDDPRHLWPAWARLIRECKPAAIFGEQISAAIGHGWLDLIQTDLEAQNYAVGKAVFGACSVGAPHIRQRLYFVANSLRRTSQWRTGSVFGAKETSSDAGSANGRCTDRSKYGGKTEFVAQSQYAAERRWGLLGSGEGSKATGAGTSAESLGRSADFGLADTTDARRQAAGQYGSKQPFFPARPEQCSNVGFLGDAESRGLGMRGSTPGSGGHTDSAKFTSSMGESISTRLEGYSGDGDDWDQSRRLREITTGPVATTGKSCGLAHTDSESSNLHGRQRSRISESAGRSQTGFMADVELPEWWQGATGRSDDEPAQSGWDESTSSVRERSTIERPGPVNGWWAGADWIGCRDGKFRPVPGTTESSPLSMVDGDSADLGYFLLPSGKGFAFSPLIEKGKERVGRLRLYGDAICIPAAQAFIESYLETEQ